MKRVVSRIAALALTFLIGATVTHVFNKCYIQFERMAVGSIAIEPDGRGGFSSYKSYDGVPLVFDHATFPTRESAAVAFQNALGKATRITEREPLYDREGKNIAGERVVAVFPPNEFVKTEVVSVISLDGTRLYEISSTSLRHALAFDKAHRRY